MHKKAKKTLPVPLSADVPSKRRCRGETPNEFPAKFQRWAACPASKDLFKGPQTAVVSRRCWDQTLAGVLIGAALETSLSNSRTTQASRIRRKRKFLRRLHNVALMTNCPHLQENTSRRKHRGFKWNRIEMCLKMSCWCSKGAIGPVLPAPVGPTGASRLVSYMLLFQD